MNPQLKRWLGLVLMILSIGSLLIGVGSAVALWSARPAITGALQNTIRLVSETLTTTQQALTVADQTLQNVVTSITVLSSSTDSLVNSIGSTQNALNSVTLLVRQDLPKTIDATRTALTSAQETAAVVDNFLGGISRIQFLNINYNPEVPLAASMGRIGDSLGGLPALLTKLGGDLDAVNVNLPDVITVVHELGTTLGEINTASANARSVIAEYAAQLVRAKTAVQPIGENIPTYVTLVIGGLTFILLWIVVVQISALVIGWRWWNVKRAAP